MPMYFVGNSSTAKYSFFFTRDNYCTCCPVTISGNSLFLVETNGGCNDNSCKTICPDFLAISHSLYHSTEDHWQVGGHGSQDHSDVTNNGQQHRVTIIQPESMQ